jgi:hypothetical protein
MPVEKICTASSEIIVVVRGGTWSHTHVIQMTFRTQLLLGRPYKRITITALKQSDFGNSHTVDKITLFIITQTQISYLRINKTIHHV